MPPKKKAKKDDQIKDQSAAQQVILDYLKQQFRPYATNDILLNLHNKIPKAVLLKALAALVDEDKLLMKAYGKLNFYVFKYSDDEKQEAKTDDGKDITLDLINGLKETYTEMNNEVKELANGEFYLNALIHDSCLALLFSSSRKKKKKKKKPVIKLTNEYHRV